MIGERDIEIVETGIRPGEKIHEILVSEEEATRTTERADHYVIESVLPELQLENASRPLTGEYSSADAVVQGQDLLDLIAQADFVDPAAGDVPVGT
jgi:UDP-glucose 4-epimerase